MCANLSKLAKRRWLEAVALLAYLGGVCFRAWYILVNHHPRHHVGSDAIPISTLALELLDPASQQHYVDTIWPPGTSAFMAIQFAIDPTLHVAAVIQLVLCCAVPLLLGHAAAVLLGYRQGLWTVALASAHLGFIHWGGFFLSEQLFQTAVASAIWTTALALTTDRHRILGGMVAGLAWGTAATFRPNALPVISFALVGLTAYWLLRRKRGPLVLAGACVFGLLLTVAPAAHRCTTLNEGDFCPGSNNLAMNIAMGHAGENRGVHFKAPPGIKDGGPRHWHPPALIHHGFRGMAEVPASLYDTWGVLRWVGGRFAESPAEFLMTSVGNAADLFGLDYWPGGYGKLSSRAATVWKQAYFVIALLPGLVMLFVMVRRVVQRRDVGAERVFIIAGVTGIVLVAFATMGEARYRVPFDGWFLFLAADLFARGLGPSRTRSPKARPVALGVGGVVTACVFVVLMSVAHPAIASAHEFGRAPAVAAQGPRLSALELERPPKPKRRGKRAAWNAKGNLVFECRPDCAEARIELGAIQHATTLDATADHNDHYRVNFYRNGVLVGHADIPIREQRPGLRSAQVRAPRDVARLGYDELGLLPLFGDGSYGIGHIRVRNDE